MTHQGYYRDNVPYNHLPYRLYGPRDAHQLGSHPHAYPPPSIPSSEPAPVATSNSGLSTVPAAVLQQHSAPLAVPSRITEASSLMYQWPDGNVRLECTEGEEPLGWHDEGWKWRSSGSRKGGVPDNAFKVEKLVCLGILHCSCMKDGVPVRFTRPKTQKDARTKQFASTCHICHDTHVHVSCDASLTYYRYHDSNGMVRLVREHHGRHSHHRPPTRRLREEDLYALDIQVRQNPQATAQQLRVGAGLQQVSIGTIDPVLLDARKARHEVEKSKARQGLQLPVATRNSGFQLLASLSSLQSSFQVPWIVHSDLLDKRYITMQTPFMADVLLKDSVRSWYQEGLSAETERHGIITDGSHDFFKEGVLLSSVVFSQVLLRWVPVLYTWIGCLDTAHHQAHFDRLINVIADLCTNGLNAVFDDQVFSAVCLLPSSLSQCADLDIDHGLLEGTAQWICRCVCRLHECPYTGLEHAQRC